MNSLIEPDYIHDYQHFEQYVAKLFSKAGWIVETAKNNQPGYDLIVKKDKQVAAVQVKWLKSNVAAPQLLKFADLLDSEEGKKFDFGFFVTTKGFGNPAKALIKAWDKDTKVFCGVASESEIIWLSDRPQKKSTKDIIYNNNKVYFGIFTCKGGVGKTTIAAHLAGAFVLQEFNVALVDLDPEQNLHKLVGDGIFVPNFRGGVGHSIEVFNDRDWDENAAKDCKIVICDCSPAVERNPQELMKKFDYCIIPTTLNPLGINKHGKVIQDTVNKIREFNQKAHLFVVINNYKKINAVKRMEILRRAYLDAYQEIKQTDDKFHCIDPEKACIRASDQLYYWGIHLLENPEEPRSELAFELVGGRCYPRDDFINLADYIETEAGLGVLRT
ncbi:restriction endonuclease [Pleurocapsales cyanobacterium LEGE 06147]|nr:restriction endonuclease [Pleurocapsales cyanobacterium LEGE 06147]